MPVRTLSLLLALALPLPALAGAKRLPEYDLTDEETTVKSAKKLSFRVESRPGAYPKKVAIGYFAARYHFKEQQNTKSSVMLTTLKFADEHYAHLTDELYAQLVARLEAEGFEVVDKDAVVGAAAYQGLEEKDEMSENGKRVRFAPTGMKNLATFSGGPKNAKDLARLNAELGTDAVVAAFVNIGLCSVDPTKKTAMRSGTYACIKGDLTMPGINLQFIGGAKGEGDKVKPDWTARWFKQLEAYEYDKKENLVFDTAIVSSWAAGRSVNRGFWKKAGFTGVEEAFVGGASEIYDDALALGFGLWEDKFGSMREAAGLARRAVEAPAEIEGEPTADVAAAPAPVATGEVPVLAGEHRCFVGTSSVAGKPIGEVLLRYGIGESAVIEDNVTLMPDQPAYRYVTTMAVSGTSFTSTEAANTWTGKGSFEPGWTAWQAELAMGNGMTVTSKATVAGDTLVVTSNTRDKSGKVNVDSEVRAKAVDEATCTERFAKVPVPSGAFQ